MCCETFTRRVGRWQEMKIKRWESETTATNLGWIWIRAAVFRVWHLEPPWNLSSLWFICQLKPKIPEALRGNREKSDPFIFFLSSMFITWKKWKFLLNDIFPYIQNNKKQNTVWPFFLYYFIPFVKTGESCWLILIFTSSGVISTGEKNNTSECFSPPSLTS